MTRSGREVRAPIVLTEELLYGGEKPFGGENVVKRQVLESERPSRL